MSAQVFLDGRVVLHHGDCLRVMRSLPANSIDAIVSDPPYHLTSIVDRFGKEGAAPAKSNGATGIYKRASAGFMGSKWDAPDEPAIDPAFAHWFAGFVDGEGCFSVHKKNVNGCGVFDCQFSISIRADDLPILQEIQRQLGGIGSLAKRSKSESGNAKPQSRYCISSQADCLRLREILTAFPLRAKKRRDFELWSQALDEWIAHEPGTSWADVEFFRDALMAVRRYGSSYHPSQVFHLRWALEAFRIIKPGGHMLIFGGTRSAHRMFAGIEDAGFDIRDTVAWLYGQGFAKSHNGPWGGSGLKPALELVCLARKPLIGTLAENYAVHGVGGLNIAATRVPADWANDPSKRGLGYGFTRKGDTTDAAFMNSEARTGYDTTKGRWPANVVHDGSEEVLAAFAEQSERAGVHAAGSAQSKQEKWADQERKEGWGNIGLGPNGARYGDTGSAARFFYTAKADADGRAGSAHPTVKPVDLMRWLVRLVTPVGGVVLDPFAGSGTTGEAAFLEGMRAVLIEREAGYCADIGRRLDLLSAGPEMRSLRLAAVREERRPTPWDEGTLFA